MMIDLPEESGTSFNLARLLRHLIEVRRTYIIQGQQNCSLAAHTKDQSLDYWVRRNVATYPDRRQATNELIDSICNTGLFQRSSALVCPNSSELCNGIELVE